ncbi:histone-lysine N-methyltransferase family member SUVH9-like [Curcuma longa]|uniref:histone-lysine N-methyltransferase family member SUVH9-like n=1 Tax=Curcuma longa TaxID=136217 RepID=UPI003D9F1C67
MRLAGVHHEDQAPSEDGSDGLEEGEIKESPRPPRTSFSSTNIAYDRVPPPMRPAGVHHEDQVPSEDGSDGLEEGEIKEFPRPPRTSFSSSNIADGGVPLPHTKNRRSDLSTAAVDSVDRRRVRQRIHLHSAGKSPRPLRCVGSPDAVYSSALAALDDRRIKRSVEKKSNLAPMTLVSVVSGEPILTSSIAAKNRSGELVTASPRPPRTSFSSSNIADGGVPLPHTKNRRSDLSTAAVDSVDRRRVRQRIHLHSAGKSPRPLRCVGSPDAVCSSALAALDDRRIKRSVAKKSNLAPMTLVSVVSGEPILTSSIAAKNRSGELITASCSSPTDDWVGCRLAVRHARILFDSLRTHYLRVSGSGATRPDLKAARAMKDHGMWLHRDYRIVGDIPGLLIGDVFFYRSELQVVGLHGIPQGGIDYVPVAVSSIGDPIVTSIIVSGGYEDDVDNGNELIYTGQGGKQRGHTRLNADQNLRAGNLALLYNKHKDMKVRVIRGFPYDNSPTGKVYVYDGLYTLQDFWIDNSKSGFSAYKYHFRRAEGQPPMGSSVFKLAEELRARKHPNGYLSWDISGGAEGANPVRLFNDIDGDNEPLFFEYRSRPYLPKNALVCRSSIKKMGCSCSGVCSLDCECIQKNGGAMPYDLHGILQRGMPMIYECGPSCPCSGRCPNRVSQKGLRYKLEVFRSLWIGWGVRSLDAIRAGAFICEFSGDVLPIDGEATNSTHQLVWPSQFPPRWAEWGDISEVFPDKSLPKISAAVPWSGFGLDLSRARNVGCYLCHSKIPNAFVQPVLYDHNYQSRPHLMVFAMENIPPLTELSIDYGDQDGVVDKEGKFLPY